MYTGNAVRARGDMTNGRHALRGHQNRELQERLAKLAAEDDGSTAARREKRRERVLRVGDTIAVFCGFTLVLLWLLRDRGPRPDGLELAFRWVAPTVLGLWAIRYQGLWIERNNAVRAIETSRLFRAVLVMGVGVLIYDRFTPSLQIELIAVACAITWVVLVLWRSLHRAWLQALHRRGVFVRRVVVIGTDERAIELTNMFRDHPDAGMSVVAMVGSLREARQAGFEDLWVANYRDADEVLTTIDADGVVLCSTDINPALLESLVRQEQCRSRDLYLDSGLPGIDFRRLEATAIAHQPLLFVEATKLSQAQISFKRGFDIVVAVAMLVLLAPLMVTVSLIIKLSDRGPVLFSQERVGKGGSTFRVHKFRTMVPDAEARLAELEAQANERTGPLFKMDRDPRITKVGRFLRSTSLDELPQLLNVIRGEMSLVGPRPALPKEVAAFPPELLARHDVRPGITGLWQVEARDNPSFEAYRRLDLFYVANYSLVLDLIILLGTVDQILIRPWLKPFSPKTLTSEHDVVAVGADDDGTVVELSTPA